MNWPHSRMVYHPDGVGIHILHTEMDPTLPTLAFLPGMAGTAEDAACLEPCVRRGANLASLSYRGRGQSTTPAEGYSVADHVSDIDLFIRAIGTSRLILVANSIGSIYAARHLLTSKVRAAADLVIVDHPLRIRKYQEGWAEGFSQLTIGGKSVVTTMREVAMDGVERESEALDLYAAWSEHGRRTLVLAAPVGKGLLTDLDLTYFRRQKQTSIVNFENSDHFVRLREPDKFCDTIWGFLNGRL